MIYAIINKLGKQGFNYDEKELFEPITKKLTDTSQNLLEVARFNTKAIENLDESNNYVKTLESMNKNEVIPSSLIRPIAKLLVPKMKVSFGLYMLLIKINGMIIKRMDKKIQYTMVSYFLQTLV